MMFRVTDPNVAQAQIFITALRDQLRDMAPRLARAECEAAYGRTSQAEAAALRRDVSQVQFLIQRLLRRFPGIDTAILAPAARITRHWALPMLDMVMTESPPSLGAARPRH